MTELDEYETEQKKKIEKLEEEIEKFDTEKKPEREKLKKALKDATKPDEEKEIIKE